MFSINKDNRIYVTRGDTWSCSLFLNAGSELCPVRHKLCDGETIYFALCEPNQPFEFALFKKTFTKDDLNKKGDVKIKINSEETAQILPGTYYYMIKLRFANGDVNTVVEKTLIEIGE